MRGAMMKAQVRRLAVSAVAGLALAAVGSAQHALAQGASDSYFGSGAWQVGGAAIFAPKFEGSKKYRAIAFPFVAPVGLGDSGLVSVRGADDVRLRLLRGQGFELGVLGGWRMGRDSSDSAKLSGFADIDGGLVIGAFAGYRMGATFLSASYHHQVTGDDTGGVVRLLAEQSFKLSATAKLVAGVGTNIASEDYMRTNFGVTAAQAGLLPITTPGAGFKDVFASATATIDLDPRWTLFLTGRYSRLVGDAADSPVIDTANQFYAGAGLSYKFSFGR